MATICLGGLGDSGVWRDGEAQGSWWSKVHERGLGAWLYLPVESLVTHSDSKYGHVLPWRPWEPGAWEAEAGIWWPSKRPWRHDNNLHVEGLRSWSSPLHGLLRGPGGLGAGRAGAWQAQVACWPRMPSRRPWRHDYCLLRVWGNGGTQGLVMVCSEGLETQGPRAESWGPRDLLAWTAGGPMDQSAS